MMQIGSGHMIIDSHQHFWQVGHFDYPWMSAEVEVLYRDYLPSTLEPILKQSGVAKTILVQASNSLAETYWLLSLSERHPFIAGVVGWVDLNDPEMEQELEVLTANPRFKGVRHLVESEPDDDWLVQPGVLMGLRVLEEASSSVRSAGTDSSFETREDRGRSLSESEVGNRSHGEAANFQRGNCRLGQGS